MKTMNSTIHNKNLISNNPYLSTTSIVIALLGFVICSDLSIIVNLIHPRLFYSFNIIICFISIITFCFHTNRTLCLQRLLLWSPFFSIIIFSSVVAYPVIDLSLIRLCAIVCFFFLVHEVDIKEIKPIKYIIIIFGLFHASGVLLQCFIPNLWSIIYHFIGSISKGRLLSDKLASNLYDSGYFSGFTYNPGLTAMYLINGLTMLLMSKYAFKRMHFNAFVTIFLFSLLLTGKRTMCIAAIFAFTICYALDHGMNFQKAALLFVPMLICIVLLYYILMTIYNNNFIHEKFPSIHRVLSGIYDNSGSDSILTRHKMWDQATELYSNNKVFGVGWNTFVRTYGNVPHNTYIQVLSELGIIGFVSFIIPLASSFLIVFKRYLTYRSFENRDKSIDNHYLAIIFFEIIYIIYSYTGNTLWDCEVYFMYFLLVSISFNLPVSVEERSEPFEDTSHI